MGSLLPRSVCLQLCHSAVISCLGFILHPKPTILCFPQRLAMAFIRYITYKISKYLAALNSLMQRTTQHGRKWKQWKGGKTKFCLVFDGLLFLGQTAEALLQFSEALVTFLQQRWGGSLGHPWDVAQKHTLLIGKGKTGRFAFACRLSRIHAQHQENLPLESIKK